MGVSFLLYLSHAIYFQNIEGTYLIFDPLYTFATLAVYPLYYWYIMQLTTTNEIDYKYLKLFIPAIVLSSTTAIIYLLMDSAERSEYLRHFLYRKGNIESTSALIKAQIHINTTVRISFIIIIIHVYFKGRSTVIKYNQKIADYFSNINQKTIHWVSGMLNGFIAISALSVALNALGRSFFLDSSLLLALPSLLFSIIFFWLGHLAYHQKYDISNIGMNDLDSENIHLHGDRTNDKLLQSLTSQFEISKIYRKQELKITDLASLLNTNRTYISNLINQEFGCSFNEYVNRYRISEAKSLIQDTPNESLEQIAIKVGYGSLSTFFRTFKTQEGMTPSHFKKARRTINS